MPVANSINPSSPESLRGFADRLRQSAIRRQRECARLHKEMREELRWAADVEAKAIALQKALEMPARQEAAE